MALPMIYGSTPDAVARADYERARMMDQRSQFAAQLLSQSAERAERQRQHQLQQQEQARQFNLQLELDEARRRTLDRQRAIENIQRDRQLDIAAGQLERAERADDLRYREAARLRAEEAQALRAWREQEAEKDRAAKETQALSLRDQQLYQTTMMRAGNMSSAGLMQIADQIKTPHIKTAILAMVDQKLRDERQDYSAVKSVADEANLKIQPFAESLAAAQRKEMEGGGVLDVLWRSPSRQAKKAQEEFERQRESAVPREWRGGVIWDGQKFVPNLPDPDADISAPLSSRAEGYQVMPSFPIGPVSASEFLDTRPSTPLGPVSESDFVQQMEGMGMIPPSSVGASYRDQPVMIQPPDVTGEILPFGPAGVGEQPVPQRPLYTGQMITPEDMSLLQQGRQPIDFTPFVGGQIVQGASGPVVRFPGAQTVPSIPMTEDPAIGGGGLMFGGMASPYTAQDQQTVMRVYESLLRQNVDPEEALAIAFERVNRLKRQELMNQ